LAATVATDAYAEVLSPSSGIREHLADPLFHPESRAAAPLTMSVAEFRGAFPGESQHVEFKRGTSMEQLQNTAVAFSNADGGVVLIGVQDDGRSPRGRSMLARRTASTAPCRLSGTSAVTD
jgi:hypothetical protein